MSNNTQPSEINGRPFKMPGNGKKGVQPFVEIFDNVMGSIREPLVVLDTDLKVVKANHSFYRTFNIVLVLGETGTGKELVARAIHNLSSLKNRALVKVNCAALPPNLIESELFGHEKGSFTGSLSKHIGRFKVA